VAHGVLKPILLSGAERLAGHLVGRQQASGRQTSSFQASAGLSLACWLAVDRSQRRVWTPASKWAWASAWNSLWARASKWAGNRAALGQASAAPRACQHRVSARLVSMDRCSTGRCSAAWASAGLASAGLAWPRRFLLRRSRGDPAAVPAVSGPTLSARPVLCPNAQAVRCLSRKLPWSPPCHSEARLLQWKTCSVRP
jgi:hypothetical protein